MIQKQENPVFYISNLSYDRMEKGITSLFKPFGKIVNIKILKEGKESKSKGVAFVEMEGLDSMDIARVVNYLNGKIVDGRTLKVSVAKTWVKKAVVPSSKKVITDKVVKLKKTKSTTVPVKPKIKPIPLRRSEKKVNPFAKFKSKKKVK